MANISQRIDSIKENIKAACVVAGRNPKDVKLVIVTKSADIDSILEVVRLGYTDLGENRVQHLKKVAAQIDEYISSNIDKFPLPKKINWHMIGHLQRNKVRKVLDITTLIQSVDTLRLAEEINSSAAKLNVKAKIFLQVNTSREPQKYGVPVGAATHLAEQIETLPNLELAGLMTIAPFTDNQDVIRSCFTRARELFDEMKGEKIVGPGFTELSMGMSSDYQIAVEEGATILRIGSAVFSD
jgi:hypothetical protein